MFGEQHLFSAMFSLFGHSTEQKMNIHRYKHAYVNNWRKLLN